MHACMHAITCARVHACIHGCVPAFAYASMHVCMHARMDGWLDRWMHACLHVLAYAILGIHKAMHTHVELCVCALHPEVYACVGACGGA